MLKIYGRASSVNVQRVLWAVDELGLAYERIDRGGRYGGLDDADYIAMNPHRRVPSIVDGDVVVWESNAIIRYLAAKYGPSALWPDKLGQRAQADQWMDWTQSTLSADYYDLFWQVVRTPASKRNADRITEAADRAGRHYDLLDAWMAHRSFMLGDTFSLADISIGVTLHRYLSVLKEAALPPRRQYALRDWYARLADCPAYRTNVMASYEELRAYDA